MRLRLEKTDECSKGDLEHQQFNQARPRPNCLILNDTAMVVSLAGRVMQLARRGECVPCFA